MILSLLLLGCGGSGGSDLSQFVPTVKFNRLDLTDISFEDLSVDFVFDVHNPDPVNLPLQRFNYDLSLADISIITGDNPEGVELESEATSEMVLPVTLEFANIYELVTATRGEDDLPFAFAGGFGWDTDIGPVDVTFDEAGDLPALRLPTVQVGQLGVTSITDTKAGFALSVDIDNDHASTLDFNNLDFKVKFAGVKVGAGTEETFGSVPGATTDTLTVPFSVDYVDAIDAIAAIASGDTLKVDLAATSDVTTPFGVVPMSIDEDGNVNVVDDTQ